MRQLINIAAVSALVLIAACTADAEKISIVNGQTHNAKRVKAKLRHVSGAKGMLETRLKRFKKVDVQKALPPTVQQKNKEVAARNAEIQAKIAEIESRQMNVQQRNEMPGLSAGLTQFFDAPHCNQVSQFRVMETRFHDVCARTDFSFVKRNWYDLGRANSAFESFCTSSCAGTINDLLQFTEGYTCFDSGTLEELRLFSAMCQWSTNRPPAHQSKLRCGAEVAVSGVFDGIQSICESSAYINSKAMCDMDRQTCQWDRDLQMCTERITNEVLQRECNECYVRIIDVISTDFNFVCAKIGDQFCLPKMFAFNRIALDNNYDFSKQMFDGVCADPLMLPCFRNQEVGFVNFDIDRDRKTYQSCINTGAATEEACSHNFQASMQMVQTNGMFWNMLCTKNQSMGMSSEYCYRSTQLGGAAYNYCPNTDSGLAPSGCDSTCTQDTARFVNDQKCCTPYLDFAPATKITDFPSWMGHTPNAAYLGRRDNTYTTWNITHLEQCSGTTRFNANAANSGCPAGVVWANGPTFWTVLNYTAATEFAYMENKIKFALKLDIGKAAGVVVLDVDVQLSAMTKNGIDGTNVAWRVQGAKKFTEEVLGAWGNSSSHLRTTYADNAIRTCKHCKPVKEASVLPMVYDIIPGAPTDNCNSNTFFTAYQKMLVECSSSAIDSVFALSTSSTTVATAAWDLACNTKCLAQFRTLSASAYGTCIATEIKTLGDLINVGCTTDNRGVRCGAVLSVMGGVDCAELDLATCNTNQQCRWNNKTNTCKDQFSQSFLGPLCNGGCITTMAATIGMNSDSFAKEAKLLDSLFCSKDGDQLCLPLIQNDINEIDERGLTKRVVEELCGKNQKLRCFKRIFAALAADSVGLGELDFYYCVETVLDDDTISTNAKIARIEFQCIENVLAATLSAVDQTNDMMNNMCSKNAAGRYCMDFANKYENSTCITNMLFENQCPANCVTEIDAALTDMGCCTGNLQAVHGFVPFANLPIEDIPEFEVYEDNGEDFGAPMQQMPQFSNAPMNYGSGEGPGVGMVPMPMNFQLAANESMVHMPKWYFFSNYQTCGGSKRAGDLVYRKCAKIRAGKTETRSLSLGISYETIAATDKKQKRFEKKLKNDLMVKLGMSSDDFPSVGMQKDTSRAINLGASNVPGRSRRATTTNAASSTISMQSEDATNTAASASAYDTAVATGTLTLTSLISLVKNECSNCTSAGTDYTSVATTVTSATLTAVYGTTTTAGSSTSGSSTTTTTTSGSSTTTTNNGASAVSFAVAALVAVVVAMAF